MSFAVLKACSRRTSISSGALAVPASLASSETVIAEGIVGIPGGFLLYPSQTSGRLQAIFIRKGMKEINASKDMDASVTRGIAGLRNRRPDHELHGCRAGAQSDPGCDQPPGEHTRNAAWCETVRAPSSRAQAHRGGGTIPAARAGFTRAIEDGGRSGPI